MSKAEKPKLKKLQSSPFKAKLSPTRKKVRRRGGKRR